MHEFFHTSYQLNDNQKEIVTAYFDHMETNFLAPWFDYCLTNKENKELVAKSILLAIDQKTTEEAIKAHLHSSYYQPEFEFMHKLLFSIYKTTHGLLNRDLCTALDYRLYNVKKDSSLDNIKEKNAISTYLSSLIQEYLESKGYVAKNLLICEKPTIEISAGIIVSP